MDPYTDPDFSAVALVTIDTQGDFLDDGALPIPGTTAVLPNMKRLLEAFRQAQKPIAHIVRLYQPDGSNVDACRRHRVENGFRAVTPGQPGSDLPPELLPEPGIRLDHERLLSGRPQEIGPREEIIFKSRWGAFYKTPLEERLRGMKVNTLVFCGCNYPNCPRTSIYEASERDFRIVLVSDALSGLYERGEKEMENIGIRLMITDRLLEQLERN